MNLSIRQRLLGLLAITALGLCILVGDIAWTYRAQVIDQTREELSNYVDNAYSIMESYAKRAEAGEMSEDEAKRLSNEAIGAMRYQAGGYFWVHDLDLHMVMHPMKPALNGKYLESLADKNGTKLFVGMNKVIAENNGAGFFRYYWGKPGEPEDKAFPKESYVKLFKPWGYVIGTGVYIDDLNSQIWQAVLPIIIVSALLLLGVGAVSLLIAGSITKPLARVRKAMLELAHGSTDIDVSGRMPPDIHAMADTLKVFRDNAVERHTLEEEQGREQSRQLERQRTLDALIADFRGTSEETLMSVSEFMDQMQTAAQALAGVAESTSGQVSGAAAASEEASTNVQTVASAAEELAASISDISGQIARTNDVVNQASSSTRDASTKISTLADAAQKIGEVVNLIQDIAEQTNLLALNATIEAARAGEMGKGFAVVASEVKSLANQTAKATEEISNQVSLVQNSTQEAVLAIQGIASTMEEVNSYTGAIAAAVEQQGSATNEISQSVGEAASGTRMVAENMTGVMTAVAETNQSADQVESVSLEASRQAARLREAVSQFLSNVAAA